MNEKGHLSDRKSGPILQTKAADGARNKLNSRLFHYNSKVRNQSEAVVGIEFVKKTVSKNT